MVQDTGNALAPGIGLERSRPGCPQDNGAHERMHADIAGDLQIDPAATFVLQQRACDRWVKVFNHVRPHEALGGETPAERYVSSPSRRLTPKIFAYPAAWIRRAVCANGSIRLGGEDYFVSTALNRYQVALQPTKGLRHRVWFHEVDLGEIEIADELSCRVEESAKQRNL